MASAAAKPCQGDSSELYLITGSIHTNQRGTVVLPSIGAADSRRVTIHSRMLITDRQTLRHHENSREKTGIGKCNRRLNPGKIQRKPTFQVVLDALALTPCYSAFLITADVPEVYMHQFWNSVYKHDTFYRFKMDKRKRFKLTLEIFRDIFKICPRVQGQDFDALPTDEEIVSFLRDLGHTREIHSLNDVVVDQINQPAQILWGMYHQKNVDYVELLWEDFIYQIDNKAYKRQEKMYYPQFSKVIIHYFLTQDKTLSQRNKIGMHTFRDDYLINTLRFVFAKEETQIYGTILPESLTSPEIKETKAYKTYVGFATGATPPKKAQKFKKPASPKLTTIPVLTEERTRKSKRLKRPAKKYTKAPARGVVIRETPEMPLSKKKEKVDVTQGKGIELLSQVALNEDSQFEEVRRKRMMDFHKTNTSGSGAVKIIPSVTSEGTGVKPGVPDVTEEESSKSKAESWGNDEDNSINEQDSSSEDSDQKNDGDDNKTQSDNENELDFKHEINENESGSKYDQDENVEDEDDEEELKDELVKIPSNDFDDEDETKITDKAKCNEDEEIYYTTSQLYDDVDIRLNKPVDLDKGFVQEEGFDAAMTNKIVVPVTSSSHSSDLAAKFLNFSDIPHTYAEIVSLMDVHVHHEVPSQQTPTLLTVPVSVISDSSLVFSTVIP
ncbi:hypothetical protein Tco_0351525 [Tanacetum coccineum]